MSGNDAGWIGHSLPRKEDAPILRGKGKYFADITLPRQLHLFFLRSPHAHARIRAIDIEEAAKMRGVVSVVTGQMIRDELLPLPQPSVTAELPGRMPQFWPLAIDKVRFHGEPVAAVVAEDPYLAEDALEAIEVDYEILPYVGDIAEALEPTAPLVHEDWKDNEIFNFRYAGERSPAEHAEHVAEVERRLRDAPHVIRQRFRGHRCGVTALEPRGALAEWDETQGLTVWLTSQRPHIDRYVFADVMQLSSMYVRVIAPPQQGGGFGMKAAIYREPMLVCHLARRLGRPVRWLETREENLLSVGQERDQIHDVELAADENGLIVAARDHAMADAGDGCAGMYWGYNMPMLAGIRFPNAYDIPYCDVSMRVAVTNKAVLSPARGLGIFPVRFAIDRAIDMLAHRMKVEPAVLRRKNLISSLPAKLATGITYDSGDFLKTYDRLMELIDLPGFRERQKRAWREGRYIGLGIGVGAEPSGVESRRYVRNTGTPAYAPIDVRVEPRGHVVVYHGDAPHGQGQETTIAQIVASELGVDPENVKVIYGDTLTTPYTTGTVASRGASYVLPAVALACRGLRSKIVRILAHDAGISASDDDFSFRDGQIIYLKSDNIRRSFVEMAQRIIVRPLNLPEGETGTLEQKAVFEAPQGMICFSAHAAFVEVCSRTGRVTLDRYVTSDDAGVVINPQIVEGQIEGGVIQGISNFFFEEYVYDDEGQQLSSTLENYKIATASDVPTIEIYHDAGTPCPTNPLGTRAIAEGCIGPVPGALGNAISDALLPLGIEIAAMPVRPATLLKIMDERRLSSAFRTDLL